MSKLIFSKSFTALFLGSLLAGCGGGGSSSTGTTPATTPLSGTAAVGFAVANGTVNIKCASSTSVTPTSTSASGAIQVTLSGQTLPCAIQVTGGTINSVANTTNYHSIATSAGNVNVTPLTDLLIANLAGTATPGSWFASLTTTQLAAISAGQVTTATTNVKTALGLTTQLTGIDPITTVFTPTNDNVMDNTLEAFQAAITSNGTSYASLLTGAGASANAGFTVPAGFNTVLSNAYVPPASGVSIPTITSFTPSTGAVRTSMTMTITGTNLSSVSDVLFTGPSTSTGFVSGVIATQTATSITTTVPASLTAGSYTVSVVHPGGEVVAAGSFTVTAAAGGAMPVIIGFSPTNGAVGTVMTITGTNIDLINAAVPYVIFNGKVVMPTSVTSSSITATVPTNLMPQPSSLTPSQYAISVNGVNGGTAIPVGTFTLTTTAVVPATPSGVTATAVSTSQVNLSWTAVPGAAGYYVYRSTATGVTIAIGNYVAGSGATTANLTTGQLPSTAYYYKVTAVNAAGESAGSAEASATTLATVPPSAPTLITATPVSSTQINLSWPTVAGATAYRVYRNTTLGFTVVKENAQGYGDFIGQTSATSFNDVGSVIASALFPSNTPYYSTVTNYYYQVTAVNAFGESVVSPEVAATTNNGPALGAGITVSPAFKSLLAFAGSAPTTSTLTPAVGIAQFQYRQTSPNTAKDFLDVTHMVGTTATTVSIQINVGSPMASACASCEKGTTFAQTGLTCTITGTTTLSAPACSGLGIAFNQVAGTLTFTNTVFTYAAQATTHTVNGTLSFTPF